MNSQLYGNTYEIPEHLLNIINAKLMASPNNKGIKRAKNLVKTGTLSYQQMKRIKNFYDHMNSEDDKIQFELMGGEHMKKFIEKTLLGERTRTSISKKVTEPINNELNDSGVKAQTGHVTLKEEDDVNDGASDGENTLKRNALVIIFDNDMRILVLKRSSYPDQWMPNKLCLVGGGVEDGEAPIEGAKREAYEETGIKLENLKEVFVIQRDETNVEHIFVTKLPNRYDTYNIKLDKENDGYMWLSSNELLEINKDMAVPNLFDYIRIAATKYDD